MDVGESESVVSVLASWNAGLTGRFRSIENDEAA